MLFDCVEHYLLCARQSRHLNNMHEIPFIPEGVGGLWHFKETLYTDCSGSDGRRHISDKYCTLHACARSLCNKQEKAITLPKSEFIVFAPAYTCKCFRDGKKKKKKSIHSLAKDITHIDTVNAQDTMPRSCHSPNRRELTNGLARTKKMRIVWVSPVVCHNDGH